MENTMSDRTGVTLSIPDLLADCLVAVLIARRYVREDLLGITDEDLRRLIRNAEAASDAEGGGGYEKEEEECGEEHRRRQRASDEAVRRLVSERLGVEVKGALAHKKADEEAVDMVTTADKLAQEIIQRVLIVMHSRRAAAEDGLLLLLSSRGDGERAVTPPVVERLYFPALVAVAKSICPTPFVAGVVDLWRGGSSDGGEGSAAPSLLDLLPFTLIGEEEASRFVSADDGAVLPAMSAENTFGASFYEAYSVPPPPPPPSAEQQPSDESPLDAAVRVALHKVIHERLPEALAQLGKDPTTANTSVPASGHHKRVDGTSSLLQLHSSAGGESYDTALDDAIPFFSSFARFVRETAEQIDKRSAVHSSSPHSSVSTELIIDPAKAFCGLGSIACTSTSPHLLAIERSTISSATTDGSAVLTFDVDRFDRLYAALAAASVCDSSSVPPPRFVVCPFRQPEGTNSNSNNTKEAHLAALDAVLARYETELAAEVSSNGGGGVCAPTEAASSAGELLMAARFLSVYTAINEKDGGSLFVGSSCVTNNNNVSHLLAAYAAHRQRQFHRSLLRERCCVVIDPIDGTNAFTQGDRRAPLTLVGCALDGEPVFGVTNRLLAESGKAHLLSTVGQLEAFTSLYTCTAANGTTIDEPTSLSSADSPRRQLLVPVGSGGSEGVAIAGAWSFVAALSAVEGGKGMECVEAFDATDGGCKGASPVALRNAVEAVRTPAHPLSYCLDLSALYGGGRSGCECASAAQSFCVIDGEHIDATDRRHRSEQLRNGIAPRLVSPLDEEGDRKGHKDAGASSSSDKKVGSPIPLSTLHLVTSVSSTTSAAALAGVAALCAPFAPLPDRGAGNKLLIVARGLSDAMVAPPNTIHKWDTLAPHAFLRCVGGEVVEAAGRGRAVTYPATVAASRRMHGLAADCDSITALPLGVVACGSALVTAVVRKRLEGTN